MVAKSDAAQLPHYDLAVSEAESQRSETQSNIM